MFSNLYLILGLILILSISISSKSWREGLERRIKAFHKDLNSNSKSLTRTNVQPTSKNQTNPTCLSDSECSIDGCSGTCNEKFQCFYSTAQCQACHKIQIQVIIVTDESPEETSWEIKHHKSTILTGSSYLLNYTRYESSKCANDSSYNFTLFDSTHDGLREGGYFALKVNDFTIVEESGWFPFISFKSSICSVNSDCTPGLWNDDKCMTFYCDTITKKCISQQLLTEECGTFGNKSVLALRIIANDAETSIKSSDNLSNFIYGTFGKEFTMTSQFFKCSYEKFNASPYHGITSTGIEIGNGVSEIEIEINSIEAASSVVVDEILFAANEKFGDLESQFDFVMLCLPPNTIIGNSENWKAYAFVNSYLSVYNDINCIYPSVQMHEVGHNIGLSHSNDELNYGDISGIMGISYNSTDGPRRCFNAPKSWELGWYGDSKFTSDGRTTNFDHGVKLVGLGEYRKRGHAFTSVKVVHANDGYDYFSTFNHISDMNSGSGEGRNEILITKRLAGTYYSDSYLVARLSDGQFYVILDFSDNNNIYLSPAIYLNASIPFAILYAEIFNYYCEYDYQCEDFDSCTIDYCEVIGLGTKCQHIPRPCSECGAKVEGNITTNSFPDALFWNVQKIGTGRGRSDGYFSEPNKHVSQSTCLPYGRYEQSIIYTGKSVNAEDGMKLVFGVQDYVLINEEFHNETFIDASFIICASDEICNDFDGCTFDYCNTTTRLCNNIQYSECSDCLWVDMNITMDNYPEETTWGLYNDDTQEIVVSGDPYPLFSSRSGRRSKPTRHAGRKDAPGRTISSRRYLERQLDESAPEIIHERICLEMGYAYYFEIRDSFGDGICCEQGYGEFNLSVHSVEILGGGNFTHYQEILFTLRRCTEDKNCEDMNFCTVDVCMISASICVHYFKPCNDCGELFKLNITPDGNPHQSTWKLANDNKAVLTGGPYTTSYETYQVTKCLPNGNYLFSIYDNFGDGMTFCENSETVCGYELHLSNKVIANGTNFGYEDHYNFTICFYPSDCDDLETSTELPSVSPTLLPSIQKSKTNNPTKASENNMSKKNKKSKLKKKKKKKAKKTKLKKKQNKQAKKSKINKQINLPPILF